MRIKDHYKTLGVKRTVDEFGIRTAFRELAKKYHPDVCGPEKTRRFQEIVEAYSVLSDPESRGCYNEVLLRSEGPCDAGVRTTRVAPPENAAPLRPHRPSFFSRTCRAEEIFELLFEDFPGWGRGSRRFERESPLDVEVVLSRQEAHRGGILPLPYPVLVHCAHCCGRGRTGRSVCTFCNGHGIVERKETVRIKIPAGVADGSTLGVATGDPGSPGVLLRVRIRVINA